MISKYSSLGKSGSVDLNPEGDRYPVLVFDNFHIKDKKIIPERTFKHDVSLNAFSDLKMTADIIWPGGGSNTPRAIPLCGFDGKECSGNILVIQSISRQKDAKFYKKILLLNLVIFNDPKRLRN